MYDCPWICIFFFNVVLNQNVIHFSSEMSDFFLESYNGLIFIVTWIVHYNTEENICLYLHYIVTLNEKFNLE